MVHSNSWAVLIYMTLGLANFPSFSLFVSGYPLSITINARESQTMSSKVQHEIPQLTGPLHMACYMSDMRDSHRKGDRRHQKWETSPFDGFGTWYQDVDYRLARPHYDAAEDILSCRVAYIFGTNGSKSQSSCDVTDETVKTSHDIGTDGPVKRLKRAAGRAFGLQTVVVRST